MLTERDREWILTKRERYAKKDTGVKRQRDYRIRKKTTKTLEDLAWLAENLAPDQHEQVFNMETLNSFTEALMNYASKRRQKTRNTEHIVYDERLFKIGLVLGNKFLTMANMLIGESYRNLLHGTRTRLLLSKETIDNLNIVYNALRMTEKTK